MIVQRLFIDHPHSVGESYGEHLHQALSFGSEMVAAGLACMLHALLPSIFQTTGSRAVSRLHDRMVLNRTRRRQDERATVQGPTGSAGVVMGAERLIPIAVRVRYPGV